MNPLLLRLIPFAVSAAVGFAIAWGIQGLRLTSAEQEFIDYKQEQVRILQEHNKHEAERQQKSAMAYAAARQEFADAIQAGEVFKRCVASGRCTGARRLRDDLTTLRARLPHAIPSSCIATADALAGLLDQCQQEYRVMGEIADGHASDVQTLMEAWPK